MFWVVGGIYADEEALVPKPGLPVERIGPFDFWDTAVAARESALRRHAGHGRVRFRIVDEELQPASWERIDAIGLA